MTTSVLAIDQGTTSSRAILFDGPGLARSMGQREFTQHLPQSGWVEHDPEDIWSATLDCVTQALEDAGEVAAVGITNQRETTLVWDRETGETIHRAIVWQDRRTADFCRDLKGQGAEAEITAKTGLLLDPYFSATKLRWILDHVAGARGRAEAGELAFGTVDSFLIWRLTGGRAHATDATNAARTMLYNIHDGAWDDDICRLMDIPMSMLPEVRDCAGEFGVTEASLFGRSLPILGVAGDQQAATLGPGLFCAGDDEIYLWDGVLCPAQHRRDAGGVAKPDADDDCLPVGRGSHLCAGGLDFHCRGGGAVAARRAGDHW